MPELLSQFEPGASYRMLELTPELEAELLAGNVELRASALTGDLVLCTRDQTFKVRQMNQSNTLLLADGRGGTLDGVSSLTAFASVESFLEVSPLSDPASHMSLQSIPTYRGQGNVDVPEKAAEVSVEQLKSHSPLSGVEFDKFWLANAGVEIDGIACTLDHDTIHTVVLQILTAATAHRLDLARLDSDEVFVHLEYCEPAEVIRSVLGRFSTSIEASTYHLDTAQLAQWFGIHALKSHCALRARSLESFAQIWRDSIPVVVDWPLETSLLKGHYITPAPDSIRYFTRDTLSQNPKIRFQQLLTIKSSWELSEMEPFLDEIRNKSVKLENFVMKYARRRTVGSKVIVTARA